MPSGQKHRRIDLFMLVAGLGLSAYFWEPLSGYFVRDELVEYGTVFVLAYLFGTFLLSPDMDLAQSDPMSNWGLFRFLWRPYAHLFKHRGISHMPVVGTLTRVLYLLVMLYMVLAVANGLFNLGWKLSVQDLQDVDWAVAVWALCGLYLPDLFHVLADRMFKNRR